MARDCVKQIVEQSNGTFTKREAKKLLNEVDRLARRKVRDGFEKEDAVDEIIKKRALSAAENYQKQKLRVLKNIQAKKILNDRMDDLISQGLTIKEAFQAELVGINKNVTGGRMHIDIKRQVISNAYAGKMIRELEKQNLLGILTSKKMTKEIANELWDLSIGNKGGKSGSDQALSIAKTIHEVQEQMRVRLNKAGADIGKADGFLMNQTHDAYKMTKTGKEQWRQFVAPLIDRKKSFGGDLDEEELLKALDGAYETLVTGVRLEDPLAAKNTKLFQFTGPGNLAKKLSGERVIHFKDADSFLEYNSRFGYNDFNEGIISGIEYGAKNIAIMERFGTNPDAMIETLLKDLEQRYRTKISENAKWRNYQGAIRSMTDEILGYNQLAANPGKARFWSNIRAYQAFTKLGGAAVSALSDLGFKSFEYRYQGKNFLSSYVQPFVDIAEGFTDKKQRNEFASLLGVGMEGMIGNIGARFTGDESFSGAMAKGLRLFFKVNGLSWWTDTHKLAMGKVMSHDLALKKDISFDALDVDTKRNLSQYGITADDWDSIRKSQRKMQDGREYIFAEDVGDVAIGEKLGSYYADRVNYGVITGGARERALTNFGTQRGTALGEAVRLMMQFKQFPITAVTRTWGRALYSKGKADIPALAQLILVSGAFGYMAMSAKDILKGKTPRDPLKSKTVFAALSQGGGLGILGDWIFSDTRSYGRDLLSIAAGPTFGQINELDKIRSAIQNFDDPKAMAFRQASSLIPGNNLFWLRPAFDYMMLYQIQEQLNPGYLRRMERRAKKDYGQDFYIKPSQFVK